MEAVQFICNKNLKHGFIRFTDQVRDNRLPCESCDGWMYPLYGIPYNEKNYEANWILIGIVSLIVVIIGLSLLKGRL